MAVINLRDYQNISNSPSQADLSSDPNYAIYQGMARISDTMSTYAEEMAKRRREMDLTNTLIDSTNELQIREQQFENDWTASVPAGQYKNKEGITYEAAKANFFKKTINEISSKVEYTDSQASQMFDIKAKEYAGKRMMSAVEQTFKQGAAVTKNNLEEYADELKKNVSSYSSEATAEQWSQFYRTRLNDLYDQVKSFSPQLAEETYHKKMGELAKTFADKLLTNDVLGGKPVPEAFKDFIPFDIYFKPENRKYAIDLMKENSGNPDYIDYTMRDLLKSDAYIIEQAKADLARRKAKGDPSLDNDTYARIWKDLDSASAKIQKQEADHKQVGWTEKDGAYYMDDISLEGESISSFVKQTYQGKMYDLFDELSGEDRVDLYKKILSIQAEKKSVSKANLKYKEDEFTSIPKDMGTNNKAIFNLDRYSAGFDGLWRLYSDPNNREALKDEPMRIIDNLFMAGINEQYLKDQLDPMRSKDYVFNYDKASKIALQRIINLGDKQLNDELASIGNHYGANFRASRVKEMENTFRSITAAVQRDPTAAFFRYSSRDAINKTKQVFNGNAPISEANLVSWQNMVNRKLMPFAITNPDLARDVMADVSNQVLGSLQKMQDINNPNSYLASIDHVFGGLDPSMKSQIISYGVANNKLRRDQADAILTRYLVGDSNNQALVNQIALDNSPLSQKKIQDLKDKGGEDFTKKYKDLVGTVTMHLNSKYKFTNNKETIPVLAEQITNHILIRNSEDAQSGGVNALDLKEIAKRDVEELTANKINVASNVVRGTIKRISQDENPNHIETSLSGKLIELQKQYINGMIQIKHEDIKGYRENILNKFPSKNKIDEKVKRKALVGTNYNWSLETLSDFGENRNFYVVIRDRETGTPTVLHDQTGKPLTIKAD